MGKQMKAIQILTGLLMMFLITSQAVSQSMSPGDGARVIIYNVADEISGDYFVQQNGALQLPYIGLVYIEGRSYQNIEKEIIHRYHDIYREPEITVQPLYRVNVLGEVNSPGVYYVTGIERLSDLLALAGGETEAANLSNLYVIRESVKLEIDAGEIFRDGSQLTDLGLKSGDNIYVPRKAMMSFRNASVLISAALLVVTSVGVFSN